VSYIADTSIREVNEKLDAVALVEEYVRLDKRGGRYWGCCPFHNEKTPSFTVDPDRKLYYCFGCHKGGTVIDFIMEMDKLSFPEAIETLAKRSGVALVYKDPGGKEREAAVQAGHDTLYELYQRVAGSFHHLLMEKPSGGAAKQYILARGITTEMINRFRLGYAPADRTWLFRFLSEKGYSEAFLASSGLFSAKYPRTAFFSDRLMFPISDRQGRTAAFGGRLLSGEGPKYLNSLESAIYKKGQTLFAIDLALPEIRRTREAYIAEGYMDVIALHQAGITNAVAPLGTAFTDDQARLLRRWADRVYLLFDADEAGQNAAVKGILTCRRNGLPCAVVVPGASEAPPEAPPPKYPADILQILGPEASPPKDPADILKNLGAEALQKSVKCFITDFEYLLRRGKALFDISDSGGKAQGVAFLFPYLETLDSEVSRDACIGDIADAFGVERQAVIHDFGQYRPAASRGQDQKREIYPKPPPRVQPVHMNDELFLLTAVLVNHGLYTKLRSNLSIEELDDPGAKEIFIALEEWFRDDCPGGGEAALPPDLLSRIRDEAIRGFVLEQGASRAFSADPELLFQDSLKRVKQKRLERRQAEIIRELRTLKQEEPRRRLEDLLTEKVHVDAELRRFKEDNE
jgi:DNA primase